MNASVRPMTSPVLQRELPRNVLPIWPALVQQFDRVSQSQLLSLRSCVDAETQRYVEAQEAAAALPLIEQAVAEASIHPIYLKLAAAAARIKMADTARARLCLRAFATSPALSLEAQTPPSPQKLVAAHPLWLVMHVAIEAGLGAQLTTEVLDCGLRSKLTLEPEYAAGLVLNAIKHGDCETLKLLQAEHVALTPRARLRLDGATAAFVAELESRVRRGVPLPALERQYLEQRCQALVVMGETAVAQRLQVLGEQSHDRPDMRMPSGWLRYLPCAGRRNTSSLPPKP